MSSRDLLTYLNGFQPAYGPLQGGTVQSTNQTIPGQTATSTADPRQNGGLLGGNVNGNGLGGNQPAAISPFGVTVSAKQFDELFTDKTASTVTGLIGIVEPQGKTSVNTETSLTVARAKRSVVTRFESANAFTVLIRYTGGEHYARIDRTVTGGYVCTVFGQTGNFLTKGITLVAAQDGQTRTITYKDN